jgi:hypothetical protein
MKNPALKLFMMTTIALVVISLALLLSAGTLAYWQAWTYLAVTLLASVPYVRLMLRDPALREGRTKLTINKAMPGNPKSATMIFWMGRFSASWKR